MEKWGGMTWVLLQHGTNGVKYVQQPFRDEQRTHLSTAQEQKMSRLCLFCSAFFFSFVSFCDQLKSKPGLCLDPGRRGKCYSRWSIGNNSRMDGCGRDSEARSSKYQILAGTGYLVCSTYAEAGPGFTAVSTKSGQSPKMRTKWRSSAISEGLDETLGRSKHRMQWQDKTADKADHTLVWLSLMQMAFPSSLDAKIHLERQSGVLSATWSPPSPKSSCCCFYQMFSDAHGFEKRGKGREKERKKGTRTVFFVTAFAACIQSSCSIEILCYVMPALAHSLKRQSKSALLLALWKLYFWIFTFISHFQLWNTSVLCTVRSW